MPPSQADANAGTVQADMQREVHDGDAPRMGSGGPAGTLDQVETPAGRRADAPRTTVRVRAMASISRELKAGGGG